MINYEHAVKSNCLFKSSNGNSNDTMTHDSTDKSCLDALDFSTSF